MTKADKTQVKKTGSSIRVPEIAGKLPLRIFQLSELKLKRFHSRGFVSCGSLNGIPEERLLKEIDSLGVTTLNNILRQLLEMESYEENVSKFTLLLDEALDTLEPGFKKLLVALFESKKGNKLQSQTGAAHQFGKYRQWADERIKGALIKIRRNVHGSVLLLLYNWSKQLKSEFRPLSQSFLRDLGFEKGAYSFGFYVRLVGALQPDVLHLDDEHKVQSLIQKEKQLQDDIIEVLAKKGEREDGSVRENKGERGSKSENENKNESEDKRSELASLPVKFAFKYLRSGINKKNDWSKLSEQRFCDLLPKLKKITFSIKTESFKSAQSNKELSNKSFAIPVTYYLSTKLELPKLTCVQLAKQVLAESNTPLTSREIVEKIRASEEKMTRYIRGKRSPAVQTVDNKLVEAEDVYLLGPKLYGVEKHLKLKGSEIKQAADDSFRLLEKYGVPFSAIAIISEIEKGWARKCNAYELAEYLKRDSRFRREGKMLYGLSKWAKPNKITAKEIVLSVLEKRKKGLSIDELYEAVRKRRSYSRKTFASILNGIDEVTRVRGEGGAIYYTFLQRRKKNMPPKI